MSGRLIDHSGKFNSKEPRHNRHCLSWEFCVRDLTGRDLPLEHMRLSLPSD